MTTPAPRPWIPEISRSLIADKAASVSQMSATALTEHIAALVAKNRQIHERDCFNLNPATNVMNPRAEAMLSAGIGTRPSLGHPGDKYEMGLEAIEEIEVLTEALACEIFAAYHAEIRVASGAMANLYTFMATCQAGDTIIAPPATIGGHVTHHGPGCAGLYGLNVHEAPIDPKTHSVDLDALEVLAKRVRPKLITIGGSLNLFPHPVSDIRAIADQVGATLLFDAAHLCGLFAGGVWANPLDQGAHLMTMSTYKSLSGPPSGLIVTREADLAKRLDKIAFPGMTANFDAAKSAALAITLLDWREFGSAYAQHMLALSTSLAEALSDLGQPIYRPDGGAATASHQFAMEATSFGGGQTLSKHLRRAGFLACGIGLPIAAMAGEPNGLRLGTPEIARFGMTVKDVPRLAALLSEAMNSATPEALAAEVARYRQEFQRLHYLLD